MTAKHGRKVALNHPNILAFHDSGDGGGMFGIKGSFLFASLRSHATLH